MCLWGRGVGEGYAIQYLSQEKPLGVSAVFQKENYTRTYAVKYKNTPNVPSHERTILSPDDVYDASMAGSQEVIASEVWSGCLKVAEPISARRTSELWKRLEKHMKVV